MTPKVVERYLALGLAMDRHVSGLVDSYYGPRAIAERVAAAPIPPPQHLVAEARALLAAIDAGEPLGDPDEGPQQLEPVADAGRDAARRHYLRAQAIGMLTTVRKLAGETISYVDEVEACYGVRPREIRYGKIRGGAPAARRGRAGQRTAGGTLRRLAGITSGAPRPP